MTVLRAASGWPGGGAGVGEWGGVVVCGCCGVVSGWGGVRGGVGISVMTRIGPIQAT